MSLRDFTMIHQRYSKVNREKCNLLQDMHILFTIKVHCIRIPKCRGPVHLEVLGIEYAFLLLNGTLFEREDPRHS